MIRIPHMEEETMKGEFMWNMGGTLDTMRLIAEGAVVLFEEVTGSAQERS